MKLITATVCRQKKCFGLAHAGCGPHTNHMIVVVSDICSARNADERAMYQFLVHCLVSCMGCISYHRVQVMQNSESTQSLWCVEIAQSQRTAGYFCVVSCCHSQWLLDGRCCILAVQCTCHLKSCSVIRSCWCIWQKLPRIAECYCKVWAILIYTGL